MAVKGQASAPNTSTNTNNNNNRFKKKLFVGAAECAIVGINMDMEQMQALGWKVEKEPVYIDTDKEGNDYVNINITLKEVTTNSYLPLRFTIYDKVRGKSRKNTQQYINNLGWEAWAENEESLPSTFAKRPYRLAKEGEAAFYRFMNKWLCLNGDDAELEFNLNKLLRGNFRELHDVVKTFAGRKVVVMATVNSFTNKQGEEVKAQSVCNLDFLPSEIFADTPTVKYFEPDYKGKKPSDVEWFINNITKDKFGCKDGYIIGPFQVFGESPAPSKSASENTKEMSEPSVYDDLPF